MTILKSSGAGHGGAKISGKWSDVGAIGNGYYEADLARTINDKFLKITKVKDTTDNSGYSVNSNLYNIAKNINSAGDGYAISHHLNAFKSQSTGVEVFYGSSDCKEIASKISATIAKTLGIVDRGAKDGSWLYLAQNTGVNQKVLLVEWCFIDNKSDVDKLLKNMDSAISEVAKIFGYNDKTTQKPVVTKPAVTQPPKQSSGGWILEKGIYTLNTATYLRTDATTSSSSLALLKAGESVKYDAFKHAGGYIWIRQPRSNGAYGYLATGISKNGTRQNYWGTFK